MGIIVVACMPLWVLSVQQEDNSIGRGWEVLCCVFLLGVISYLVLFSCVCPPCCHGPDCFVEIIKAIASGN